MDLRQFLSTVACTRLPSALRHGLMVGVVVGGTAFVAAAQAEEGSLKPVYEQAAKQPQTAEGVQAAMAKYRSIVDIHMANEEVFQAALRRLAEEYEKSGKVEEGIRFFSSRIDKIEAPKHREVFGQIFRTFAEKHPEAVAKVVGELQGASRPGVRSPAVAASSELAQAILQRNDPQVRSQALQRLQKMLGAEASDQDKKTALATLGRALTAKFDRTPFRPLVVPLLTSNDAGLRRLALGCLPGLGATADDLPGVARLAEDPSPQVRQVVGTALIQIAQGAHAQVVIPALTRLLRDPEPGVIEATIRSMWGQYSSPEFDALLIELSREPRYHHNVIYFGLSTMRTKSVPVCRRLVEELADPDWNNSGRAAWGLTYGVTDEAKKLVEEGLLRALPEETNAYTRRQEFQALRAVATPVSRPYLTSVVESTTETEEFKQLARRILAELDKREASDRPVR